MTLRQMESHISPFYCWVDDVASHYFRIYDIHGRSIARLFRDPIEMDADYELRVEPLTQPELYETLRYALDSACRYIAFHGWTAFRQSTEH